MKLLLSVAAEDRRMNVSNSALQRWQHSSPLLPLS
jgi:hypothetical protein